MVREGVVEETHKVAYHRPEIRHAIAHTGLLLGNGTRLIQRTDQRTLAAARALPEVHGLRAVGPKMAQIAKLLCDLGHGHGHLGCWFHPAKAVTHSLLWLWLWPLPLPLPWRWRKLGTSHGKYLAE